MKLIPGSIRLEDVVGGTLGAGVVPLSRMWRQESLTENAAQVVILAADTLILQSDLLIMKAGDRVLVVGVVDGVKGGVAGNVTLYFTFYASTGSFAFGHSQAPTFSGPVAASAQHSVTLFGIGRCITEGNANLQMRGNSQGSNLTCSANIQDLAVIVLRDSA